MGSGELRMSLGSDGATAIDGNAAKATGREGMGNPLQ
jgi:hypothetical protein